MSRDNGDEVVMATFVAGPNAGVRHPAARNTALRTNPSEALTIDTDTFSPPQIATIKAE